LKDAVFLASLIVNSLVPLLYLRFMQRREIRRGMLEIDRAESDGVRLAVTGVLTEQTLSALNSAIQDEPDENALTLDLSGVTYLDSRALGYLYALRYRCAKRICIEGNGARLNRLLRLHKASSLTASF
jgi:anti-anti-sigma regulatory factor